MSYHLRTIEKGIFGHASKIKEEFEEFQDAMDQGNPILELVELSDLIGAIEAYVLGHYDIELDDLIKMKDATNRAFNSGHRVSNDPTIEEVRAKTVLLNEFDSPDRGYGPGLGGFVPGGFAATGG